VHHIHRLVLGIAAVLILVVLATAGGSVLAQGYRVSDTGLDAAANAAEYNINQPCATQPGGCVPVIIGQVVNALLAAVGALFLVLIIWGGAQYMLSQGDPKKVAEAKQTIQNAIIGMFVVAASYAIASFVLQTVSGVTNPGAPAASGSQTPTP
jgi:hypothetical protein